MLENKEIDKVENIVEVDNRFIVPNSEDSKFTYFDVTTGIFEISGFPWLGKNKSFSRLEVGQLDKLSEGVRYLSSCTAGGVIRFASDSSAITIKVELTTDCDMPHMPRTGSSGIDLYKGSGKNKKFVRVASPDNKQVKYEAIFEGFGKELCEWTINMPLYNGVKKLEIGLQPGSELKKPMKYSIEKPIVFYGSSITQGGCASRPGNAYTHIICRWLDANLVNLGFSGSAKGEPEIAELISQIDMSAFVMDYDHNAPNAEELEKTHEIFFRIIRKAHPELPVIIVSMPDFDNSPKEKSYRRSIIYATYKNAFDSGDKNVYFIDGETLFGAKNRDSCTVDGCHPNDLGFMRMAENIYPVVKKALEMQKD